MCIGPTAANGTRPRQRQPYFVIDRQKLAYLDLIEKANCVHSLLCSCMGPDGYRNR